MEDEIPVVSDRSIPFKDTKNILFIDSYPEVHSPTLELILHFIYHLQEHGWDEVYVFSEPCYLRRCVRDLKKILKMRGVKCKITPMIHDLDDRFWFDPASTQWWTRSRWLFLLREIPIRLLPFGLYRSFS